jgi:hypothetical protein
VDANDQAMGALSFNELSALSVILQFYERHLWNRMLPSAKRSRLSLEVSLLIVKLSLLPEGFIATLQGEDIDYINDALSVFTSQVTMKLPPSEGQTSVLMSCRQLQVLFAALAQKLAQEDKGKEK